MGNKSKNIKKKKSSVKKSEIDFSQMPISDVFNILAGSNRSKQKGKEGSWMVESVGDHQWMFVEPRELREVYDDFDYGCILLEEGEVTKAEKLLRKVVRKAPLHIDALHHLAIIQDVKGETEEARKLWTKGVEAGRSALTKKIKPGDLFEWGWIENRPYLRCLDGLATRTLQDGDTAQAMSMFEELLSFNPNDNQGVREDLVEIYLEQNELKKAVELCRKYKDDILVGVSYGYPLTLFKLGKREQASKMIKKVIKKSPKIAKELFKKSHKKPKSEMPGYLAVGSWDEAYIYWQRYGKFWDAEALEWLRTEANKNPK